MTVLPAEVDEVVHPHGVGEGADRRGDGRVDGTDGAVQEDIVDEFRQELEGERGANGEVVLEVDPGPVIEIGLPHLDIFCCLQEVTGVQEILREPDAAGLAAAVAGDDRLAQIRPSSPHDQLEIGQIRLGHGEARDVGVITEQHLGRAARGANRPLKFQVRGRGVIDGLRERLDVVKAILPPHAVGVRPERVKGGLAGGRRPQEQTHRTGNDNTSIHLGSPLLATALTIYHKSSGGKISTIAWEGVD